MADNTTINPGTGGGSTVSAYDAASAINPVAQVVLGKSSPPVVLEYGLLFAVELFAATSDAAVDVTVVYD